MSTMPVTHRLFKPASFDEGRECVVGHCNGMPMAERWEHETPFFAKAILSKLQTGDKTILDYGVGVGRLAKEIVKNNPDVNVLGIDDSSDQRRYSTMYVADERYKALAPTDLNQTVDLTYCIYVLQHVPAIELREILQRIHHYLKPEGKFIYCSSDCRMAIRFDQPGFVDDRMLGVNLRGEIERFFEPVGPLFTPEELKENDVVRRMIDGDDGSGKGLPHPAIVYKRRNIEGLYFNVRATS